MFQYTNCSRHVRRVFHQIDPSDEMQTYNCSFTFSTAFSPALIFPGRFSARLCGWTHTVCSINLKTKWKQSAILFWLWLWEAKTTFIWRWTLSHPMNLNYSRPTASNQRYEPQSEGVKDGILFNSLYRMTFMPGCRPILSPGVARRQERPRRECILGNDESDEWNPQLCHLLSARTAVIAQVNGKKSSV